MSARKIMNNDNEPPSLMQFWSQADEKLVINKSWPKQWCIQLKQQFNAEAT